MIKSGAICEGSFLKLIIFPSLLEFKILILIKLENVMGNRIQRTSTLEFQALKYVQNMWIWTFLCSSQSQGWWWWRIEHSQPLPSGHNKTNHWLEKKTIAIDVYRFNKTGYD